MRKYLISTSSACLISGTVISAAAEPPPSYSAWAPLPLIHLGSHQTVDRGAMWRPRDFPRDGADLWYSSAPYVGLRFLTIGVDQMVTAQCASTGSCPAKMFFVTRDMKRRVKQLDMCPHPTDLMVSPDGLKVRACGQIIALHDPVKPGLLSRLVSWLRG